MTGSSEPSGKPDETAAAGPPMEETAGGERAGTERARVPGHGTLLGLDFGTKRIGIAISTPEQTIACPL
ncbi:MAG TPA: hypothetical protein EYP14_11220, partial [Planctomycetaceae bacterium]|nr:hypothetical protein [Planctomycetaceae bacterium]